MMKNRAVGFLILGIAILIGFITFSFNRALTEIVDTSCQHGPICPMQKTLEFQTNVSIGVTLFLAAVGLYLIFFGEEEKIITKIKVVRPKFEPKKVKKEDYREIIKSLDGDEKLVFEKILEAEGSIFQSQLIDRTGFSKVKVTRILDKLEGRGLVERRRRGMTNVVILKHQT